MRYKIRQGVTIGTLAAENDTMLHDVFVDSGYVDRLYTANDSAFLLLGRAGSGKTALIRKIEEVGGTSHVAQIDPEELSMQYLQNSVLREISSWGVNLDIFYKYLWRHICILALMRMRYSQPSTLPSRIGTLSGIREMFFGERHDTRDARAAALAYMENYSDQFWVSTDTKVKKITSEIENRLRDDSALSAHLGHGQLGFAGHIAAGADSKVATKVEQEIVDRAQEIVSQYQIADLNRVVELVTKHGFDDDTQAPYLILIDDLDKNWMPDDNLYLELLKSLLIVVRELNYRLGNAKIIVALREDIYQRVYHKTSKQEAQREKWSDVQVKVRWSKDELVEMATRRLGVVFKEEYTNAAPSLQDILPERRKGGNQEDPIDYILDRTLMRPRDVIDFVNRCLVEGSGQDRLTWADLTAAEIGYAEARLQAIADEWANCYYGLRATFALLTKLGRRFVPSDITEQDLLEILVNDLTNSCPWLTRLAAIYSRGSSGVNEARKELLTAWFTSGLVAIKDPVSHKIILSLDRAFISGKDDAPDQSYITLKMVRPALGITRKEQVA